MYVCPRCKRFIGGEARKLIRHLRTFHALSDSQDFQIVCCQNNCQRTYHNLNSYRKHLKKDYSKVISNEQIDYVPGHFECCNMLNDDEIDNEPIPEEATVDLRTADSATLNDCASAFVAQMYSSPNTTLTDVQRSVTCAKEVLDRTIDIVEEKMLSFIDAHSLPHDDDAFKTLMQELENGRKMFEDVDTPYKITKYFSDKKCLVKPTDIFLGHRADTARKNGQMTQVLMSDTCQYIPIIDTIRFLFSSEKMQSLYMESNKSIDGKMPDYSDGAQFATHPLYSRYPDALQIQLYFDDVETTNPLGSKTKIHKMGAVYFSLKNLPAEYNSSLANIHLCLLFNSIDKETYGFTKILQPLLDDIKYLESHGIAVDIKGQTHLLYGTICLLTADNLACHSLCGYLEFFS